MRIMPLLTAPFDKPFIEHESEKHFLTQNENAWFYSVMIALG